MTNEDSWILIGAVALAVFVAFGLMVRNFLLNDRQATTEQPRDTGPSPGDRALEAALPLILAVGALLGVLYGLVRFVKWAWQG